MFKNKINSFVGRIVTCCIAVSAFLSSCTTVRNVSYLQDIQPEVSLNIQETQQITLQPGDRLRITVFSRDRDLSDLFNLYDRSTSGGSSSYHPYTVSANGTVEMPTLGMIRVQGLTRQEAADEIKYQLLASKLLLDPTVIVEYYDMSFYALGEVNRPGRIQIPTDQLNILEAIALAGDLTINGRRENILVFRTEDGVQTPYQLDLTNTASIYGSPVYYLQQNDMIYVEPNAKKATQADQNAGTLRSLGFWMSLPSYILSLILILK
jgi:polysaccharide export outer membrane protein